MLEVTVRDYEEALPVSQRYGVSINDAIAYIKMKERGLEEITLDKHFSNLPGVRVLP